MYDLWIMSVTHIVVSYKNAMRINNAFILNNPSQLIQRCVLDTFEIEKKIT